MTHLTCLLKLRKSKTVKSSETNSRRILRADRKAKFLFRRYDNFSTEITKSVRNGCFSGQRSHLPGEICGIFTFFMQLDTSCLSACFYFDNSGFDFIVIEIQRSFQANFNLILISTSNQLRVVTGHIGQAGVESCIELNPTFSPTDVADLRIIWVMFIFGCSIEHKTDITELTDAASIITEPAEIATFNFPGSVIGKTTTSRIAPESIVLQLLLALRLAREYRG